MKSSPASKSKTALREQLQHMEKELESMFEPGKSMPRVGVVAVCYTPQHGACCLLCCAVLAPKAWRQNSATLLMTK